MNQSHPSHFHRPDTIDATLYVITVVFNPQRYRTRWKLYKDFERYVLMNKEAHLVSVECTFGERSKVVEEHVSERHTVIHVQTKHELWVKENLINLAIQRLPEDWKYVAWVDADVAFIRPDWVGETLHQLQHYKIVQMFSVAIDVDSSYVPFSMSTSFCHDYIHGIEDHDCYNGKWKKPNPWHTGYAWAARRETIVDLGGLIDWGILGSSDNHMARCLIGEWEKSVNRQVHAEYRDMLRIWQERALMYVRKNVGYVKGGLIHYFHGAKENRRYKDRWQILVKHNFQPSVDLKKDWNGVYQLTERNIELRRDIQEYFKVRDEDSTDMKGIKGFF